MYYLSLWIRDSGAVFFFFFWTIPSLGLSGGVMISSTPGFQDTCEFFDMALIKRWTLFLLLNLGWLVNILINRRVWKN